MSPFRKFFAPLLIVGVLAVGGVACSSSDSGTSTAAWCKKYEKFEADESANADDTDAIAKMANDLAKDAPKEIRADMKLLADVFKEMDSVDLTDEKAVEEFGKKFDEKKIDAAGARLETFMKDKCGVKTDS